MRVRGTFLALCIIFATGLAASDDAITVHEWGTFTSVAGRDGEAVNWLALSGKSDLPCFVHRLDQRNLKLTLGTVRMETPVLYFYPLRPSVVSVHVDFPDGRITEWYPRADGVQSFPSRRGSIDWKSIDIDGTNESLPRESEASHYYAARETDAWPLHAGTEREKLLFYRGIGDFAVPLRPVVNENGVSIRNAGTETVPEAILFENHAGTSRYRTIRSLRDPVSVNFSELAGNADTLRREVEDDLAEMGLYRKEAHAMIETWRDSWFEEGLRVFYIVPRATVDALLPLSITPAPNQLSRVFVGRVEVLAPWMNWEISAALANGDIPVLKKYGRFLNAFLGQLNGTRREPVMSASAKQFLEASYAEVARESQSTSCGQ
jgi:hypothetical protein